ncbi:MAG: hypothetical protein LBU32_32260 [Clostridiales bacterium]|nr:hypothetical protein [Clostridiales bacterium]
MLTALISVDTKTFVLAQLIYDNNLSMSSRKKPVDASIVATGKVDSLEERISEISLETLKRDCLKSELDACCESRSGRGGRQVEIGKS